MVLLYSTIDATIEYATIIPIAMTRRSVELRAPSITSATINPIIRIVLKSLFLVNSINFFEKSYSASNIAYSFLRQINKRLCLIPNKPVLFSVNAFAPTKSPHRHYIIFYIKNQGGGVGNLLALYFYTLCNNFTFFI